VGERAVDRAPVRIGNGQAFWGDTPSGPRQLIERGGIDYLTMDFLAEITMSVLHKARRRRPAAGYATDFVEIVGQVLPACREQGVRVVANAGGVNPLGCAAACEAVVRDLGLPGVRIGVVDGDDILDRLGALADAGQLDNLDTGEPLRDHLGAALSANAYLGAAPIAAALDEGADVVVTGRVADAALALGPLLHELRWAPDDWDRLAAGTVAGHILECGTQATGGNFDRWRDVPAPATIGWPVVEVDADGTFVVTKPEGTGGMVSADTVTAQLLYEIGDPARYLTPDVVADFTTIRLVDEGGDRVRISGVRGGPATDTYKVSVSLAAGWKATGQLVVAGPDAVGRARAAADLLFDRLAADGARFEVGERLVELIGTGVVFPGMCEPADPVEVVLRIGVHHHDRDRVERFTRELASLLTAGPSGLTGFAGGRPKASDVVAFWPALVAKEQVSPRVQVREVA